MAEHPLGQGEAREDPPEGRGRAEEVDRLGGRGRPGKAEKGRPCERRDSDATATETVDKAIPPSIIGGGEEFDPTGLQTPDRDLAEGVQGGEEAGEREEEWRTRRAARTGERGKEKIEERGKGVEE